MSLKKILIGVGVLFLVFFLVSQPGGAANVVHNILGTLKSGGDAMITFVRGI